jgi:hypothetical protein
VSEINRLQDEAMVAIARAAAHEGTALGVGSPIDELPEALVWLVHASPMDFVARYGAASKALHENWTRRVGTPSYRKSVWMDIDVALSRFARAVATSIGYDGPWALPQRVLAVQTTVARPARAGDVYRFTYENELQFNRTLLVERTLGDGPDDLVLFEDHSHSKQKYLGQPGAERVSP